MNDYFSAPDTPVDFTTARGSAIRQLFAGVAAAFDKLPSIAELLQGRVNFAAADGDGNTITATYARNPGAYVEGASFRLKLNATNTAAASLNVNALGAKAVKSASGADLVGGELVAGSIQDFTYVGGVFRLPATGPAGPQGPAGPPNGNTILTGTVDPVGATGANGDYYIKLVGGVPTTIFGPKAAGAWPAGVGIKGADGAAGANGANGANGNTVLYGTPAPGGGTGVDGNFYIDTDDHIIYGPKAGGVWPAGVSLVGPAGAAGAPGAVDTTALYNFTNAGGIQNNGNEVGFRDLPFSRSVAANFVLAAADRGKYIQYTDTGDQCQIPLNTTVPIPVDAMICVINNGTGPFTIVKEAGVTMKLAGTGATGNKTAAVGAYAWFHKIATNTWFVGGPGVS